MKTCGNFANYLKKKKKEETITSGLNNYCIYTFRRPLNDKSVTGNVNVWGHVLFFPPQWSVAPLSRCALPSPQTLSIPPHSSHPHLEWCICMEITGPHYLRHFSRRVSIIPLFWGVFFYLFIYLSADPSLLYHPPST